ncbi:hypothetical protein P4U99_23025 [Brevibacillus agri]|uniref:hypothetical protein n=1 Tax=Brevibacillus TaxID=55080 RepID=UPI0015623AA1|nr:MULTISPECIES: hypothetical protein [Brevibacillus]MBE5394533.1 hypothetical protein [Brevibacillus borstelensis]MED1646025.1 hypothetical protein [Brevibacillus agri]MED1656338.1 hypothetical protein [Brevibacillus agri]MED1689260.1 hypothetical protein [Brevibacillus agri]MED1693783.1 hypothetical protein [Brevibacillus agri]
MQQLAEKRVKQHYLMLRKERTEKDLEQKSLFEEAMSCYFSENYRAAFILAYVHLTTPIAINSKRLHKRKNRKKFFEKKDPYKFNLIKSLEECVFLTAELKSELSKTYKVTLQFPKEKKEFTFSLSQIRNITVHPEDDKHRFVINRLNYKEFALQLLDLAPRIHDKYDNYLKSPGKEKRKTKENKVFEKIYI